MNILPVSALIPTRHRAGPLARTLTSVAGQSAQPLEIVVVDASTTNDTERVCRGSIEGLRSRIVYRRANQTGAAPQRNEALSLASQSTIALFDDDILFEEECIHRLWTAFQSDQCLGGVNAMIVNERYKSPGSASRALFRLMAGRGMRSYAGRCLGPGLNLLPEDRDELPEVVATEWLNSGCTLYRREALPIPMFPQHFTGYSLAEDLTLSLTVANAGWKLANARTARIFHDSQPGEHKNDRAAVAAMDLVNRYYVMTRVLRRTRPTDYALLVILQAFGLAAHLRTPGGFRTMPEVLRGKARGLATILGKHI